MKLLIAGSRELTPSLCDIDDALFALRVGILSTELADTPITHVISGQARGADEAGEAWARARLCTERPCSPMTCRFVERHPADWQRHGVRAGPIRNRAMGQACDAALVFWNGSSPGTAGMIRILEALDRPHLIVRMEPPPLPARKS